VYRLVLLTTGGAIPIFLSLLRFVPFPKPLISKFNAIFIEPPLFGQKHRVPVLGLGLMPTRGQALFLFYIIGINIILSAVGYVAGTPDSWFTSQAEAITIYIANRVGVLSLANLPLLLLYSGRNNVLLWVTNWSHSTFLLIHRWVAVICTIQACLHSAIYLQYYSALGKHSSASSEEYWIWGIIGTLALSIIIPASLLPLRQKIYEIFIASHFVLALLALVGCFLHIVRRFENQWGYETWIYMAFAVWGFDWLIRSLRVVRNGVRTAHIKIIDEDYLQVSVPGIVAQGHAYLYFPTLTWRIFENHPFSVISTMNRKSAEHDRPLEPASSSERESYQHNSEKSAIQKASVVPTLPETATVDEQVQPSLTFFIRSRSGISNLLRKKDYLPVLIETSYGTSLLHEETITTPNVILIAGGVGITAIVPYIRRSPGRVKLFWGVRNSALVDAVKETLRSDSTWHQSIAEIAVGHRLDLRGILEREAVGETTVVICGPPGMADEVRKLVCEMGSRGSVAIKFIDESFSW
jgi:hypothetical protein